MLESIKIMKRQRERWSVVEWLMETKKDAKKGMIAESPSTWKPIDHLSINTNFTWHSFRYTSLSTQVKFSIQKALLNSCPSTWVYVHSSSTT